MIDLDRELRALLEEDARHAPPVPEPREAIRRARRRQVGVVLTALAMVAAVAAGSFAGVSAMIRSSERRVPIGPAESPTPSPVTREPGVVRGSEPIPAEVVGSEVVPAVVSGSALDDYVETTFPAVGGPPDWAGVYDLAVAPDGAVWAVPWYGSVARFDGESWTTYTAKDGLPRGSGWTVDVAPDGTVWAAGAGGLARFDGETWIRVEASTSVREVAFAADGSVVAGLDDGDGVARLDGGRGTWHTLLDQIPGAEWVAYLDVSPADGAVWVGTRAWWDEVSILRFDGSAWTSWGVENLPGRDGRAGGLSGLIVAPDGSVWALTGADQPDTEGEGILARFDGQTWTGFSLPTAVELASMALGPDGTIWIGGGSEKGNGTVLMSFDGSAWTSDRVHGVAWTIEVAVDGSLWMGLDDTLVRFTPAPA